MSNEIPNRYREGLYRGVKVFIRDDDPPSTTQGAKNIDERITAAAVEFVNCIREADPDDRVLLHAVDLILHAYANRDGPTYRTTNEGPTTANLAP